MPNNFGGDQYDEDYAPHLYTERKLHLRPSTDPDVLIEQLRQSLILQSPPQEMRHYKGYLAQIVSLCMKDLSLGHTVAPKIWFDIMAPALHQVERIANVEPEVARDVWMVQWMLEVTIEALKA
jgi:hypothetical protein